MDAQNWDFLPDYRYVEAYPRLEIRSAMKGLRNGCDCVIWRDQHSSPLGWGSVVQVHKFRLDVSLEIHSTEYILEFQEKISIVLEYKKAGDLRSEAFARCEGCNSARKYLIYKRGAWMCAMCQNLVNRSSMISRRIHDSEMLNKLKVQIGRARRPSMHQSTYDRLCVKRDALIDELGGRQFSANENHANVVTAEWVSGTGQVSKRTG